MSGGAAANRYEAEVKVSRYAAKCSENGLSFYPLVVEVYGGWRSKSAPVFDFIAKMISSRAGILEGAAKN